MSRSDHAHTEMSSFDEKLHWYDREAVVPSHAKRTSKTAATVCACSMAVGAVLGLAQPSLSAIYYSGIKDIPLNATSRLHYIDFVDIGQAADFAFSYYTTTYTPTGTRGVSRKARRQSKAPVNVDGKNARGTSNNMCLFHAMGGAQALSSTASSYSYFARNLSASGSVNSSATHWRGGSFNMNGNNPPLGPLAKFNSQTGYIGVRVPVTGSPGHYYYGWIRYRGNPNGTGTIVDWAYENQQDMAIAAGAGAGAYTPAAPIPALDEWGALILFALLAGGGVVASRRAKGRTSAA